MHMQLINSFRIPFTTLISYIPIIATVVTNDLVNRTRITFVHDMAARTGRSASEMAEVKPTWSSRPSAS